MEFLNLVTSEAIRGVLGVEVDEIPDTVFTDTDFSAELQYQVERDLSETIEDIIDGARLATSGYAAKLSLLRLFAKYTGALVIFPHVRFGVAESVSDGQNSLVRSKGMIEKLQGDIASRAEGYKNDLLELYSTTAENTSFFGSASPSYDPVTDESS